VLVQAIPRARHLVEDTPERDSLHLGFAGVTDSDGELVDRLRAGDEQAFSVLVRRYHPSLLRLACSLVDNRSVAEEAVQDTWMGVVRGIERFEGRSSVKTWLFRILVNRTHSAAARERRSEPAASETHYGLDDRFDRTGAWISPPVPWAEEAEDRLAAENLARRARACLDRLPSNQRQAVLLRDIDGLTAEEVCSTLRISNGNLRVLLHRGRARIRGMLAAEMGTG
jgi:RNA polymerase sigma-70 factor (ECF subfamily)